MKEREEGREVGIWERGGCTDRCRVKKVRGGRAEVRAKRRNVHSCFLWLECYYLNVSVRLSLCRSIKNRSKLMWTPDNVLLSSLFPLIWNKGRTLNPECLIAFALICPFEYNLTVLRERERERGSRFTTSVDAHRTSLITFLTFSGSLKKYSNHSLNR